MKNGFLILCGLLCSQVASAKDMGNYGLTYLSENFAAPVVFDRTAINAPQAGAIVYDSGSTAFFGLPPGVNPNSGWVQLSVPSGSTFFASSKVTTSSSGLTSTSFSTFSNSPTLTLTPSVTGTYKVYAGIVIDNSVNNDYVASRVFNTSGAATLLYESQGIAAGHLTGVGDAFFNSTVQSVYTLTAGTTYTFDIQGKVQSGDTAILDGTGAPFYMFAELSH